MNAALTSDNRLTTSIDKKNKFPSWKLTNEQTSRVKQPCFTTVVAHNANASNFTVL